MLEFTEETRTFESMKDDLLRTFPGRYAVVCGRRLVGVFDSVDEAVVATSQAFAQQELPAGAPILISEIAEKVTVRVMATPAKRSVTPA
jgi:hypothetical protein